MCSSVCVCGCASTREHETSSFLTLINCSINSKTRQTSPIQKIICRVFFFSFLVFFYSALFHSVCFLFFRALFGSFSADVVFTFNSLFRASTGFSTRIYFIILSANIFRAGRSQFVSLTFFFSPFLSFKVAAKWFLLSYGKHASSPGTGI